MSKELEILKKIKVALGMEKEVEQTEVELAEDNKEVKKKTPLICLLLITLQDKNFQMLEMKFYLC